MIDLLGKIESLRQVESANMLDQPAEETQPVDTPKITPQMVPETSWADPPPFDMDKYLEEWNQYRDEQEIPAQWDIADVIDPIVKYAEKRWQNGPAPGAPEMLTSAVNRAWATLFTHMDTIFEAVESFGVGKRLSVWKDAADYYEQHAEKYAKLANEKGIGFLDEMMAEAVGGGPVGVGEFALKVPYAAMLGASEARLKGENMITGAIVEGAKRGILGAMFKAMEPLTTYLKAPIMGTVFGVQAASEGATPRDIAKAVGTGGLYSLTSPGGKMGINELKTEIKSAIKPELDRLKAINEGLGEAGGAERKIPTEKPEDLMSSIASLQRSGQPRSLVSISALRDKVDMKPEEFDAQLLQLSREGKVALHKHDSPLGLSEVERSKLLVEEQPGAYHGGKNYYVGVVPKVQGLEGLREKVRTKEQEGLLGFGPAQPQPTYTFLDPVLEERYQKSVPQKPKPLENLSGFISDMWHNITRDYENLPNTGEFADIHFALKKLEKQKGVASHDSIVEIGKVLSDLDRMDYDLFARKVVLDDLAREAQIGRELPWGLTPGTAAVELARIDQSIAGNAKVTDALAKRTAAWDTLKTDYIQAMKDIGLNVKDRFTSDVYFRHQILEYVNLKGLYGTGKKLKTPSGRGFLKRRVGSELDINRDYIQPEYEVMSQMLYDIQVAETIKLVDDKYNISKQVRKDAKKQGMADWHDAIPDGYEVWQPREGNLFFMADSIPANLANKLHTGALQALGITEADLKPIMAMGGARKEFVIKSELASTLDALVKAKSENVFAGADKAVMRGWKIWQLISPRRLFKYNIRNLTGDADAAFVGNFDGFRFTPQASKALVEANLFKKEMTGDLKDWYDRGGMQSTLQVQEMGEIQNLWLFDRLYKKENNVSEIPSRAWKGYWNTVILGTDTREAVLRFSNYLSYLDQMKADPNGRPRNFGASRPEEIMGLKDIKDRAYWLSNDLLGAYDRVGVMGQTLRDYIFPFWSWKEVNFKRYVQFTKNAANEPMFSHAVGKAALGTATKSAFVTARIGAFVIKATAFAAMLQVWNKTMYPELEAQLSDDERARSHIIFGQDADGNILLFNRIGALGDFLDWFGLGDAPKYVDRFFKGEADIKQIAKDMAKSPVNVVVQGITPQIKVPAELITGRTTFPDIFWLGMVRDRGLYLAQHLGLENEYKAIAGLPSKGYGHSVERLFLYSFDPGQSAYNDIQGYKRKWLEQQGKGWDGFWLTAKSNAIYNTKLALRYKDTEAFDKYSYEYLELGGSLSDLMQSLKKMDPLTGLSKMDKLMFIESLSDDQRKKLDRANEFYLKVLMGGEE